MPSLNAAHLKRLMLFLLSPGICEEEALMIRHWSVSSDGQGV
ncbi:MAG TPA: hypothetical protein PLI53_11315 [Geobacteraceae bacterium]|nr:hypothetical protein [Geobacteraceae bacterium]